jgi:hypothetical protein
MKVRKEGKTGPVQEWEGKRGGGILYSCMKTEQGKLLKLF